MALMSPATTEADVDLHSDVFDEAARELSDTSLKDAQVSDTSRSSSPARG
jgi:hypothetical protein